MCTIFLGDLVPAQQSRLLKLCVTEMKEKLELADDEQIKLSGMLISRYMYNVYNIYIYLSVCLSSCLYVYAGAGRRADQIQKYNFFDQITSLEHCFLVT